MRNDDDLCMSNCSQNQPRKRRQQVGVQAGLWFIQDHQLRWTWCKESCGPKQKTQRPIRQLGGGKRTQQSMLLKLQLEAAVSILYVEAASGEGVFECGTECFISSDFHDGLEGSGEIAAVMMENGSESTDLNSSGRRFGIAPEVIVKAPSTNAFPHRQHFGSPLGVSHAGEHAIRIGEVLRQLDRFFIACG